MSTRHAAFAKDAAVAINLGVLRAILKSEESMVAYYSKSEEKLAQNVALVAAGLSPLHSESSIKRDLECADERRIRVRHLSAAIAYLEKEGL